MESPYNPNGSFYAVESVTSPDGRVLGKMGHSERYTDGLMKNIPGNKFQPIFLSGVQYFKLVVQLLSKQRIHLLGGGSFFCAGRGGYGFFHQFLL